MCVAAGVQMIAAWSLPDWVSIVSGPLAVIGLVIAIVQLFDAKATARDAKDAANHARTASESAKRAAETAEQAASATQETVQSAERRLADNHLLVFIPRLEGISRELERAAADDDSEAALEQLSEWRSFAAQVRKLAERKGDEEELVRRLQLAAALTSSAKGDLIAKRGDAEEATRHVRGAINEACDRAAEIVGEKMAYIGSNIE